VNAPAAEESSGGSRVSPRPEEITPVGLLHNMSMRPTTAVRHDGVHCCRALAVEVAGALELAGVANGDLGGLCRNFGLEVGESGNPAKILAAFLHATVRQSTLPDVAPVWREPAGVRLATTAACIDDLALALAVASKSSRGVFVRDKSPIVSGIWNRERIILLLPGADVRVPTADPLENY